MVRRTGARPRSSSLVLTLVSIALGASLPGVFVVTLWGDAGSGMLLAGLGLTLALSGTALAVALRTLVTRRLQRLAGALARLTEGDFTRPLGARGGDEIASVMRMLDDLADRLRSRSVALQSAERRYRLLHEHGPAAMFRTKLDGSVVDCNAAAARMLGFESVNAARASNAASYYADSRERGVVIERLRRHGVLPNLPVTLRGLDGRPLPVRLTLMQSQENGETYLDSVAVEACEARAEDGLQPAMALGMSLDREVLVAS